ETVSGVPKDLTPPLPPSGFIVDNGDEDVALTWTANTEGDLKEYRIYRNTDSSAFIPDSSNLFLTILPPAITYKDIHLVNGIIYYYRFTALDTSGNESAAGELVVGIPTDQTPPADITDLEVVNYTSNYIELSWTATGGDSALGRAHSYDLRFSTQELTAGNFDQADSVTSNVPSPGISGIQEEATVTGLNPKTFYYFAIKAIDSTGNVSGLSNVVYQRTEETPTLLVSSLWGKFHRDNQNSGRSPINGTDQGTLVWSYETGGDVNSSPVVDDVGDVYFGSDDGSVYALSADGQLKWRYATGSGVAASPLVASLDRLYVGSKSGVFYCFNRTTGDTIWTHQSGGEIYSSAVLNTTGRLFYGDLNGNLICLDSEFGSLYWQGSLGSDVYSSPALSPDGSTVYVGAYNSKIYAMDVITGEEQWNYLCSNISSVTSSHRIYGSLAVDEEGVIYTGNYDKKLYAVNPDGTGKWTYLTGSRILYSSPAFGNNGEVYIGSNDEKIYCVDKATGNKIWSYETDGDVRSSPAVSGNGNVYFGSRDDKIYALDQDGVLLWTYSTDDEIRSSSPAIGPNGNIYIGSNDKHLYLIGVLDTIPPSVPESFTAISGDERVILTWDINPENDLSKYLVYKGTETDNVQLYDSVGFSYNTFVDSTVENDLEYFYSLKAVDQLKNKSFFTDTVSAVPHDLTPPPAPAGLTAVPGDEEVTITWDPLDNIGDFLRYRLNTMNSDSSFTVIDSTSFTGTPEIDLKDTLIHLTNMENNTTYSFSVTAVDTFLNVSEHSNIVSTTPYDGPVWYVSNNGNNNNIGYITEPFLTIQYAVDYAEPEDTVMVLPGNYAENIVVNEKSLVISGLGNPDSIIIDGGQAGSVVTVIGHFDDDIEVAVENMTITNGAGENGAGVYVEEAGSEVTLNLNQLILSGNTATANGGGVFLYGDVSGTLSNSLIINNNAVNGAGVALSGAYFSLWNSTFSGNVASGTAGSVYSADESEIGIFNCIISENGAVEIALDEFSFAQIDYSNVSGGKTNIVAGLENLIWESHNLDDEQDQFVSRGTSEYSLNDFSPFIGRGSDGLEFTSDLYGLDRDSLPGPPDLGAIESPLGSRRPESRTVYDGGSVDLDWFSDSTIITHWMSFIDNDTVNYEIAVGNQIDTLNNIVSWTPVGQDTNFTLELTDVTSGVNYFVSVRAVDTDYQMSDTTTSDGFVFDFTPPTVGNIKEVQADADRDYLSDSTNINFTWSASDDASGLQYFEYALGLEDSIVLDWAYAGLDTQVIIGSFPFVEGNSYHLLVRSVDVAGNLSDAFLGDGFLIDYTAPETGVVFDGLSGDLTYMGSDSTSSAYWIGFSDDVSGIDYYETALGSTPQGTEIVDWTSTLSDTFVTMDSLALFNGGAYYLSVRAFDVAGNVSTIISSSGVIVDTAPPTQGLVYDGSTVDLDWSNQENSMSAFWTGFIDSLSGTKDYSVSIGTAAGQEDVYAWTSVGDTNMVVIEGLVLNEEATYFFNVIATDSVDNAGLLVSSDGVTIDRIAPTTVLDLNYYYYGPNRWGDSPDPLSGGASDELSGVQFVEIMINRTSDNYFFSGSNWSSDSSWVQAGGDTSWAYNNRMVGLDDGHLYKVYARATDRAGNIDYIPAIDTLVFDSSPPITTVEINREFYNHLSWNADTSISGTAVDSVSGVDSIVISIEYLDGSQWFDGSGWSPFETWQSVQGQENWHYSFSSENLSDSVGYRVYGRAIDLAGNEGVEPVIDIFTYDISGPTAGQVYDGTEAGSDIDWTNEDVAVNAVWSGFDDIVSGIKKYEYKIIDGSENVLIPWTDVGLDTFVVDSALHLTTGMEYAVNVRATDMADNASVEVLSDGVIIDTIPPVITFVYEGSNSSDLDFQFDNSSIVVAWGGGDTREIAHYSVSLGSAPEQTDIAGWVNVGNNMEYVFTNLALTSGNTCYANIRGHDQADNISDLMSGDGITIDQDGPTVGYVADYEISDVDWTATNNQIDAYITGFADTLSGVNSYYYRITPNVVDWSMTDNNGSDSSFTYVLLSGTLPEGPQYFVEAKAVDAMGNESNVVSSDGFRVDVVSPVSGTVSDGFDSDLTWTNNDGSLAANWSGFTDAASGIAEYQYSIGTSAGNQNTAPWATASGTLFSINQENLSLVHGTMYFFNVLAADSAGNQSSIVSSNGITLDIEAPVITSLKEGEVDDPDFQANDNTLSLYSDAQDNLSGINTYQFSAGTSPGDSDVVVWESFTSENPNVVFEQLSLDNGAQYFGAMRVSDLAGNIAQQTGDGIIIDITPPETGIVIDLVEIDILEDQDLTNSITTMNAYISGFSDSLSGVDHYEYAVGTAALFTDVKDWSLALQDTIIVDEALPLEHAQTYFLSARAYDAVGNLSASVSSDGITVDEFMGPPVIVSLSLQPNSWISPSHNTTIDLDFSEPVKSYDVSVAASITSGYSVLSSYTPGSDSTQMQITLVAPFASMDSVTFGMLGLTDLVDNVADTDTFFSYPTHMVGDFNTDNIVDILDLNEFVNAWESKNYLYETGPVTGEIPYFIPDVDNVFDLRDVMAFTRMWHYTHQAAAFIAARYEHVGPPANIYQDGQYLVFQAMENVNTAKVILSYPETSKKVYLPKEITNEGIIRLSHRKEGQGLTTETAFIKDSLEKTIRFKIESFDRDNALFDIDYIALDNNSSVVSSGRKTMDIIAVPDKYALHPNYPNPFNPLTRINYDIPKDGPVELIIFDILGREVITLMNANIQAGYHNMKWRGVNKHSQAVGAGVYFLQLRSKNFTKTIKMLLLK
ncbi:MAG: hypothetical protein CMG69_01600, partial [Candidatus Marinimicrobia bacterium]|nr:hypothetical protein [Candidatus Neomarinimicrobiota bacterium]